MSQKRQLILMPVGAVLVPMWVTVPDGDVEAGPAVWAALAVALGVLCGLAIVML